MTVDELQELDGELDVPDAAPPPLELPVDETPPGHLALGPGLHAPHFADLVVPVPGGL